MEQIKRMWYLYMTRYYSAKKKGKIIPGAAAWMDLKIVTVSEKESEKWKTNTVGCHLCVESKLWHKWIYLWDRITDMEGRLVVAKGDQG